MIPGVPCLYGMLRVRLYGRGKTGRRCHPVVPWFCGALPGPCQVKIEATSPGLVSAALTLTVEPQPPGFNQYWCANGPRL